MIFGRSRASKFAAASLMMWALSGGASGSYAAGLPVCASEAEAQAFRLRHLQSRLMVAGLACNQQSAYGTLVERFRERLAAAGGHVIGYFQRTGAGDHGLNKHITDLANAAGILRATVPEDYCAETWSIFLTLADHPDDLEVLAAAHTLASVAQPRQCGSPDLRPRGTTPLLNAAGPPGATKPAP